MWSPSDIDFVWYVLGKEAEKVNKMQQQMRELKKIRRPVQRQISVLSNKHGAFCAEEHRVHSERGGKTFKVHSSERGPSCRTGIQV